MIAVLVNLVVLGAVAAQGVVRGDAPNVAARPAALLAWQWPDCGRVLSAERDTFAESMCRAAAARTRYQSAADVLDANAPRYRGESVDNFRRAVTLASSTIEKRAALSELAATYAAVRDDVPQAEAAWRELIALEPSRAVGYLGLARAQESRGGRADEEATLVEARQAVPRDAEIVETLARFYRNSGQTDDSIRAFREFTEQAPQDANRHWRLAIWYWQLSLPPLEARAAEFLTAGLNAVDRGLLLNPDDFDILNCKYVLLRRQAELTADPAARDAILAQAQQLRGRILELKRIGGH